MRRGPLRAEEVYLYVRSGLSIIPLAPRSKRPLIDWKIYQTRHPTDQELEEWFANGKGNIGIVCGGVSGNLYVLDLDDPALLSEKPIAAVADKTLLVRTSRGLQIYLKSLVPARLTHRPSYHLDLISDGGFVVAPPSIHPSGCKYEFASEVRSILEVEDVNKIVEWLDEKHNYHSDATFLDKPLGDAGIVEGERNDQLFRSATVDRELGLPIEAAIARCEALNRSACRPPLPLGEVSTLVHSAYSRPYFENAAQKIVNSNGESKADIAPKTLKALEEYVENLRLRIVGEQPPAEAYESLNGLYEDVVNFYQTSLRLDALTPYLFASYTLLTHQTPNLDFIFQALHHRLEGQRQINRWRAIRGALLSGIQDGLGNFPIPSSSERSPKRHDAGSR